MARYIDADKLWERRFTNPTYNELYKLGWNDAVSSIIAFEPTADIDIIKIVQCDGCNNCKRTSNKGGRIVNI